MPAGDEATSWAGEPSAGSTADTPHVSVIMIFLDAERFIEEAIQSVLSQSYDSWELILVDDGSTDESTRIAKRHARLRPRQVRYIEHEGHRNLGMSAARNAGIGAARGELIAFLDADDVFRPEKLERQVAILERQPRAAMVYGATQHWYSWTGTDADRARDCPRRIGVPPDSLVEPPALVARFLTAQAQTPGMCGLLVRRAAIERIGRFEDRFRGMFEDQVFLFKLCLGHPVFVEGGSWDRYRQHPQSFVARERRSGNDYKAGSANHRAFVGWLQEYLAEQQIDDRELLIAVRRQTRPYRYALVYRLSPQEGGRRLRRRLRARGIAYLDAARRLRGATGGRG